MITQKEREDRIFTAINELVGDLVYYDRREDPDLPLGSIEAAVVELNPGPAIMAAHFEQQLRERIPLPKEETIIEGKVVEE
jgi:hypothetical protein